MTSFFETVKKSFAQVPTEPGVDTIAFIAASEDLVRLFDFLNSTAFAPVKSDMNGNIAKIRKKYDQDPSKYVILQNIVADEAKLPQKERIGTEGLMWLRRGLEFTCTALKRNVADEKEELGVSFTKAYEQTLQKYHGMFIRPIFHLAMKACPYRKDFYKKLSGGDDEQKAIETLRPWLNGLDNVVNILVKFYQDNNYGW